MLPMALAHSLGAVAVAQVLRKFHGGDTSTPGSNLFIDHLSLTSERLSQASVSRTKAISMAVGAALAKTSFRSCNAMACQNRTACSSGAPVPALLDFPCWVTASAQASVLPMSTRKP